MTAMPPTWTILVPTLGERRVLFERLMADLLPQLDAYQGRVQVTAWFNNGRPSLPEIRQRMVMSAQSEYVCFVDDDDRVSPFYVDEIMHALDYRRDYVGFQVQCYSDGHPTAVSHHSLKHGKWINLADRYLRDISHLNPIRTAIARKADFTKTRGRAPEDRAWADQLRKSGLVRTEVVIPRIMYHYLYSTSRVGGVGSRASRTRLIRPVSGQSTVTSPYLTWSDRA